MENNNKQRARNKVARRMADVLLGKVSESMIQEVAMKMDAMDLLRVETDRLVMGIIDHALR